MGVGTLLRRFWFEFELPPRHVRDDGTAVIDDRPTEYLRNGVGVTGYDEDDCLWLIDDQIMRGVGSLPPLRRVTADVDVNSIPEFFHKHHQIGVPVWRGVWAPPLNRLGPVVGRN